MNYVTRILSPIEQDDPHPADDLLPLVSNELRKLAAQKLAKESPGQTLQATALVHEAYVRLVCPDQSRSYKDRIYFLTASRRLYGREARADPPTAGFAGPLFPQTTPRTVGCSPTRPRDTAAP